MRRSRLLLVLTIVIGSVFLIRSASAQSEQPATRPRIQQIALFKNGLGFFVCQVRIPDDINSFSIAPDGAASHGTFWVAYPPKVKLSSLVAGSVDFQQMTEAVTIPELLRANIDRSVRLNYKDKDIEGIIRYFPDDRRPSLPSPYALGTPESVRIPRVGSRLMLIETDAGQIAIDPYGVQRIEFLSGPANTCFALKDKSTQIDVTLAKPAGGKKLTISYLAKGITWAPSYMVDITDPAQARISAKAAIINEIADLDDVQIQLVTGFPNLQFSDIVSPLALKENLAQFLQALTKGQSRRGRTVAVMAQRSMEYMGAASSPSVMPDYGSAQAGTVAEDLFFYPIASVTLKKGQVGYYPLFTESVSYEHVYRWDIPDYINQQERYVYGQQPKSEEEEIWHCLKIDNSTEVPWTTAPAEVVQDGLILGQDTLEYTVSGDKTVLRITKAMSVKAQQIELETERKRGALNVYGRNYDLVSIQGTLSVKNFQDKSITLEITKTLSGQVTSSDPAAKIEKLARGLRRVNELSQLTWTIELSPSQEKELVYTYQAYVRR